MSSDPTILGVIQDVQGSTISVSLNENISTGLIFINGYGYKIGQLGSFVRIPIGLNELFGIVSQVGASAVPERIAEISPQGYRWLTVQLIGEGDRSGNFKRGVSQFPTVGDAVNLVTDQDLVKIYGRPNSPEFIRVGHLASAESIPALIDINRLVTRHSAVVGTTGAGKSTTVAGLIASLADDVKYPSARAIIFDIHGEYAAALSDKATVFRINPDAKKGEKQLSIPYWAMTFDELVSVTFGTLEDPGRGAVLEKISDLKLNALKRYSREGVTENTLTVDTPIPFSIHKLWFDLYKTVNATHSVTGLAQNEATEMLLKDASGKTIQAGDALKVIPPKYHPQVDKKVYLSSAPINIRRQIESLSSRLRDPRYDFLFKPGEWFPDVEGNVQKDLDSLLEMWIGSEKAISILDLSGIPSNILDNLVGVLLRILYDALFWSRNLAEGGRKRPLLVVLEEAHAYLSSEKSNENAATAVKRIVKEGRKYGIGAMVVSQRPSEIDPTILSQCGTIFAMRLSNANDRTQVISTASENLQGLFNMLPVLRIGEAIVVGEAVHIPIRTLIDPPQKDRKPDSGDPIIYSPGLEPGGWNEKRKKQLYSDVILAWRSQNPRIKQRIANLPMMEVKEDGKNPS